MDLKSPFNPIEVAKLVMLQGGHRGCSGGNHAQVNAPLHNYYSALLAIWIKLGKGL